MGAIKLATSASTDEEYGGTTPIGASNVGYDNTSSGLTADDVQGAIDEIDAKFAVFDFSLSLNFTANTWNFQTVSATQALTIPSGYRVVSAFATTNYPHADLVIPNVQEGKSTYGFMTYSSRTVSNLATSVRAVLEKV